MMEERALTLTKKRYRKIQRKVIFSFFSLLYIFNLPLIEDQYFRFDSVYNTKIVDLIFLPNDLFNNLPFLENASLFLSLMTLSLLFLFVRYYFLSNIDYEDERDQTKVKRTLEQADIISFIFFLLTIYVTANAFFFSFARVDGSSMDPTFTHGDGVILSHYNIEYARHDIVVALVENDLYATPQFYIKRLIGLPGETVTIDEGSVMINDVILDEPYLADGTVTNCSIFGETCTFTLSENEYFILGDNRSDSRDSRQIGAFEESLLYGVVNFRVTPISTIGKVD